MPPGGTAAAGAGTGTAAGKALVTGGAVVAAAGSVLLLCFTVKAVVDGKKTPIDIADRFYGTHFGDIPGWVQGRYASNDTAHAHAVEVEFIISNAPNGEVTIATHALNPWKGPASSSHPHPRASPDSETSKDNRRGRIYATYTKFNKRTSLYYSGRASIVTGLNSNIPLEFLARLAIQLRDANHHVDENNEPQDAAFMPAVLDKFDIGSAIDYAKRYNDVAYWRIRGREQQLIDFHGSNPRGGAQSDTGKPYRTENAVRAVAKDNPRGRQFHDAATTRWGQLYPYTGH